MTGAYTQTTLQIVRFVALAALVAAALAGPAPAQGIDPGVNYDPAGPAGKEYAIPLVLGRAEGAGTEDQRAAANTPFGVGITARNSGDEGDTGGAAGSGKGSGNGSAGGEGAPRDARGDVAPSAEQRAQIARAEEPASAGTWTLAIWLAVLLGAALIALALRGGRGVQPAA